jgi:hypothetical protein
MTRRARRYARLTSGKMAMRMIAPTTAAMIDPVNLLGDAKQAK